jgi:hypothetical protein
LPIEKVKRKTTRGDKKEKIERKRGWGKEGKGKDK